MGTKMRKWYMDVNLKMIWILVFTVVQVPCLALHKNIQIGEVTCTFLGMTVNINLEKGFNGAIFAEGNYFNPVCRYNRLPALRNNISFFLPENNCGMDVRQIDGNIYFSNTIIIQNNRMVETDLDTVHNVSCKINRSSYRSTEIPQDDETMHLDVYESNGMTSWMEFEQGSSISSSNVTRTIEVGEDFFLAIHHENSSHGREIRVRKCWAHDRPTVEESIRVLRIFDMYDCEPSEFVSDISFDQETVNSQIVSFVKMKAFKLPSALHLHITCSVEVCGEECNDHCYNLEFHHRMKNRQKRSITDNRSQTMETFYIHIPSKAKTDNRSRIVAGFDNRPSTVGTDDHRLSMARNDNRRTPVVGNDKQSRAMAERVRLMKATIKALGKTILKSRATSPPMNDSFLRRARLEDVEIATETTTDDSVRTTITIKVADAFETSVSYTTPQNVNYKEDYEFNLTKSVIVLPLRKHASNSNCCLFDLELGRHEQCVSRLRFSLVTTMLCTLSFLLLLISIALAIALRHEKKKRRIDSFLLYNFR